MAARTEVLHNPPPSRGIIEEIETEKQRMDREAQARLFDKTKKKRKSEYEVDLEEIKDQIHKWEEEFETERAKKGSTKDVRFLSGWGRDD